MMWIIYFILGLQTVKSPQIRDIGVQCSSAYTDTDICVEEVGVQCSLLVTPITSTPLKYHAQSDTSQSESDTDMEEGPDTSEYTLSQEDTSL